MLAPLTEGSVLRIEPPLIADAPFCDQLIKALKRLLDALPGASPVIRAGSRPFHRVSPAHRGSLRGRSPREHALSRSPVVRQEYDEGERTRFAFVMHLIGIGDLRRFDPSLEPFGDGELERLKSRIMTDFAKPFPFGELSVRWLDGDLAEGVMESRSHFCLQSSLHSPVMKRSMSFNPRSIWRPIAAPRRSGLEASARSLSMAGLPLRSPEGVSLTSGNSLTAWAAIRAVESACARSRALPLEIARLQSSAPPERLATVFQCCAPNGRLNSSSSAILARPLPASGNCARSNMTVNATWLTWPPAGGFLSRDLCGADAPADAFNRTGRG